MATNTKAYDALIECKVPEHDWNGLIRYVEDGYLPGGFLTAVLENDLMGALGHADIINQRALPAIGQWLYNYAPAGCYGSKEAVQRYCERKRIEREALKQKHGS